MSNLIENPKVFISYSWTNSEHQSFVEDLARRLAANGIDPTLDIWSLQVGQDKYAFMERMVTDPSIHKVLVIIDKGYSTKADARKGGVGTESTLISAEIYERAEETRFIPIVVDFDEKGAPILPAFMKARIYINLSNHDKYQDEYMKLVRLIFGLPVNEKPSVGKPPEYILNPEKIKATSPSVLQLKQSLASNSPTQSLNVQKHKVLDEIFELIKEDSIPSFPSKIFDETVVQSIERLRSPTHAFSEYLEILIKTESRIITSELKSFFERCRELYHPDKADPYGEKGAHTAFVTQEMLLYVGAFLLKAERFSEFGEFLNSFLLIRDYSKKYNARPAEGLWAYLGVLDEVRNQRLSLQRRSVTADLIMDRLPNSITQSEIILSDFIYFLHAFLKGYIPWVPRLLIYHSSHEKLEFFIRCESKDFFEKVISALDVKSVLDFKEKYMATATKYPLRTFRLNRNDYWPLNISESIQIDDIAKY